MPSNSFADRFSSALRYETYLATGAEEQRRRWTQVYEVAQLDAEQKQLIAGFEREIKILVHSGIWCGDCVEQCPLLARIAESNPSKIDLRFFERPMSAELSEELRINGGSRVPVVQFFSEDGLWCATAGDRTLNRYRALALKNRRPRGGVHRDRQDLCGKCSPQIDPPPSQQ